MSWGGTAIKHKIERPRLLPLGKVLYQAPNLRGRAVEDLWKD